MIKVLNKATTSVNYFTPTQLSILVILRLVIGWHFLFEGVSKILNSNWSSIGFLLDSQGPLGEFFNSMAANPGFVNVVDFLNVWGLTAIGLGLITGLFTQVATLAGIVLLAFYFFSHPPLISTEYLIPSEGNYLFINKNLIELVSLWVLFLFPTGKHIGLDRFFSQNEILSKTTNQNEQ